MTNPYGLGRESRHHESLQAMTFRMFAERVESLRNCLALALRAPPYHKDQRTLRGADGNVARFGAIEDAPVNIAKASFIGMVSAGYFLRKSPEIEDNVRKMYFHSLLCLTEASRLGHLFGNEVGETDFSCFDRSRFLSMCALQTKRASRNSMFTRSKSTRINTHYQASELP